MASELKRSPLTARPLNLPGQSVDDALRNFVDNHIILPLMCVATVFAVAVWEGIGAIWNLPRQPDLIIGIAFLGSVMTAIYAWIMWKRVMALKLGRDGERAVGQFLDSHVDEDATVFHDVPTARGNIDHVVICSRGIYAIETKTRAKPASGRAVVLLDDNRLLVAGNAPDRDPVLQARACADEMKRLLMESTGKAFEVRPVVVFPGWYIEDKRQLRSTWVLEPKALPAWIKREPVVVAATDVHLASYNLSRHIRTHP